MSQPFVGEIRMVGFNFAPTGWALCNGQLLPIVQNTALFSLLGTTYGGNGVSTFGLPDLRARGPMHQGSGPGLAPRVLGQTYGVESVTLTTAQMPAHGHGIDASQLQANRGNPVGGRQATSRDPVYTAACVSGPGLASAQAGVAQPHSNMQPSLVVNFIIALQGIFPPRS